MRIVHDPGTPTRSQLFAAFLDCLLRPGITIIWTTNDTASALDRFQMLADLAKIPKVKGHIKKVRRTAGDQGIEFVNGSRILFKGRVSASRGFTSIDVVVFDQEEDLTEDMRDAIAPMQVGVENPETIRIRYGVPDNG